MAFRQFYKEFWDIVGDDVWRVINNTFWIGKIESQLVETLIVLFPKKYPPTHIKDLRPISLSNVVYKLISSYGSKIKTIPWQSSFIPKRSTRDNAIIAQEVMHHMNHSKKKMGYLFSKIDLEKAYDSINWELFKESLIIFGFPSNSIKLIINCVSLNSLSLLWNGSQIDSFMPTRRLRQGYPLSLYLFLLCMERLSHLTLENVERSDWKLVQISRGGPTIFHMFFYG